MNCIHGAVCKHACMNRDRWLATVSGAQLATGVVGVAVALKERHAYDIPLFHGRPENVGRDALVMGTAFSAPGVMLAAQGYAISRLHRGAPNPARLVLGALGATMVVGYLSERLVRRRLHPSSWHALESPLVATGIALAATMAVLGLTSRRGHE
jgi:hypothetical protein